MVALPPSAREAALGRGAIFLWVLGGLAAATLALPSSAQERWAPPQQPDCEGADRFSPACTQANQNHHHRNWANRNPPRPVSGEKPDSGPIGGGVPSIVRPGTGYSGGPRVVRASRTFVAPGQYPPEQFAAYGIVAFPARPNAGTRGRFLMVCREYWSALSASSELNVPLDQQMVTVWPVQTEQTANFLSAANRTESCEKATAEYDLGTAQQALLDAETADGEPRTGRGPYLLAWAPSSGKGQEGVLVLSVDMSSANAPEHFQENFRRWRQQIEMQPELWQQGWSIEEVRNSIRDWVDQIGVEIATLTSK